MSRRPDPSKQQEWEERLQRYEELSQTIANFCQTVGVSEPSFYYWKQKLTQGCAGLAALAPLHPGLT